MEFLSHAIMAKGVSIPSGLRLQLLKSHMKGSSMGIYLKFTFVGEVWPSLEFSSFSFHVCRKRQRCSWPRFIWT